MNAHVDFDEAFYLRHYPDIRDAGINPYQHFIDHGRAEGRLGVRPVLQQATGGTPLDRAKATILVVSHEASLTGAPILSLNLVSGLREKYNVVSLLFGDGPLRDAFWQASVLVAGPMRQRHNAVLVGDAIAQLVEEHVFSFALVNSIESAPALQPLARLSIPTVALIHEFASYTRPRTVFRDAFFWADEVVFSTRLTYQDALSQHPELAEKPCQILPQGRCEISAAETDPASRKQEIARVAAVMRPAGAADSLLVVGLGLVHIRKGVDLFLDCAAKVKAAGGPPCRFVWVGKGYDPEHDLAYSVYLANQIQRAGLQHDVHFMDDTPEIEEVYEAADVLLLTSRLDPLPNVAIDAMSHGLPLVCFDRTTGIADILSDHGMAGDCVVPYLDTAAMAGKILELAWSPQLRERVGQKLRVIARDSFDMARYIGDIHATALVACEKVAREREIALEIDISGLARHDFLTTTPTTGDCWESIRWNYVRPWTSALMRRKPFPGFHPGIYSELQAGDMSADPLTSYLRAGRPSGPWNHEVITSDEVPLAIPENLRVALHLHVYYPELLPEMLQRLACNHARPDLFVSVPTPEVFGQIERELDGYSGLVVAAEVPNLGRDIGPLLTAFGPRLVADYDVVGHLHTKKTADVRDAAMADSWRRFLLENLLGGASCMMDIILGRMAEDSSIGIVFPDDPHIVGWEGNRPHAEALCRKLGMSESLPRHFVFPVGTMFWARVDAIRPLMDLGLGWKDYPVEPLPYDGSMLHALERLLPFVVSKQGGRCLLTNVTGVTR